MITVHKEKITKKNVTLYVTGNIISLSGILDFDSVVDLETEDSQQLLSNLPDECRLDLSGVTYSNNASGNLGP